MNQDVVLENSVSRYGWRFVHVMCGGKKPDAEMYAANAPAQAREKGEWGMHEWYEKGLDVWHLTMWWKMEDLPSPPTPLPKRERGGRKEGGRGREDKKEE